ncbi:MAG: hypothetical protein OEW45_13425 [Deltaproteobacteria bacterium]|nr:hypothetical protein [Deltaproteobacteria bacterium]
MKSVPVAVGDVDEPPVIKVHIIGLNHLLPPGFFLASWIRNIKPDLPGMVRIGDIHHSEAGIKVGDIKQGTAEDLAILGLGG